MYFLWIECKSKRWNILKVIKEKKKCWNEKIRWKMVEKGIENIFFLLSIVR